MKRKTKKKKDKRPLFWFGCYGTYSSAKEDCAKCQQLKWCRDATYKPSGKCVDIDTLMSVPIPNNDTEKLKAAPDHEYFDERNTGNREYSRDDVMDVLMYVLSLSLKEFVTLQAKIVHPCLSFNDNARRQGLAKSTFEERVNRLMRHRPELEKCLRKIRKSV